MLLKLHDQWPAKIVILIIIAQMIMLGYFSNSQSNMVSAIKDTTVNIFTPCPKAQSQAKTTQQLCQNHLNASLNSILTTILFPILSSRFIALTNHIAQYKTLTYSIYKPPKN